MSRNGDISLSAEENMLIEECKEEIKAIRKKTKASARYWFESGDPLDVLSVVGLIQLAFRHPGLAADAFPRLAGMRFINSVRRDLCNDDAESAIYKAIERGFKGPPE